MLQLLLLAVLMLFPAMSTATCSLNAYFSHAEVRQFVSVMGQVAQCSTVPKLCAAGCGTRDETQIASNELLLDRFYFALQNQSCWDDVLIPSGYTIPTQNGELFACSN